MKLKYLNDFFVCGVYIDPKHTASAVCFVSMACWKFHSFDSFSLEYGRVMLLTIDQHKYKGSYVTHNTFNKMNL